MRKHYRNAVLFLVVKKLDFDGHLGPVGGTTRFVDRRKRALTEFSYNEIAEREFKIYEKMTK